MVPDLIHNPNRVSSRGRDWKTKFSLIKTIKEMSELFPDAPLLVEQMVKPGVELITGLMNDEHFGHA